ncbi:MAG: winged helix-turn-helix domain-containing protein [Isosphaeraceae bacterium]|nr:winged helix-turn-helix domain-containing protein [Isosphaeraceae bacterium]
MVDAVRGEDALVSERAVDLLVMGLRGKLADFAHYVETVRGVGYRLRGA